MKINIQYKNIDHLLPYANNARTHSDAQVAQIAASIREFGFVNPVLVRGDLSIIAGHGRVMAAKSIGMEKVPVIVLDYLSERQAKALVLADNKLAMNAGWDLEKLSTELSELSEADFDISLIGFDEQELDGLLKNDIGILPDSFNEPQKVHVSGYDRSVVKAGLTDDDEVPVEPVNPVSALGDVWILGEHRLMCGDSTDPEHVGVLMDGGTANLLLTDPPYNVSYTGKTAESLTIKNDKMDDSLFRNFLFSAYKQADNVMNPGACFYIWHADSEGYNFRGAAFDIGWRIRQCLVWNKNSLVLGRQDYHWKHEPCLYGWKDGAAHYWGSDRSQTTVLDFKRPVRNGEHPTMKPVELFVYQVQNSCPSNGVVLDLFGGSGTTLIACEKTGRIARLMELDPKYVDVIIKRWQDFTGKEAIHSSGKTFLQIKAGRE